VSDQSLLPKSTIYVSLEPCSHFGKTPPCADLIINKKIKNVVIGSIDPHSKVAGRGIEKLRNAGCQVVVGVLESECNDLNKRFFKYHQQNRPYIFLKWAQTKDGFMDIVRSNDSKKESHWISNSVSRQLAHKLRAQEQAILVGCNTVLNDNPKLTCRDWFGENPLRLVIDSKQRISKNHHILSDRQKTVVFNKADNNDLLSEYVGLEKLDFKENIPGQICNYLYDLQIQSVISSTNETIWKLKHQYCNQFQAVQLRVLLKRITTPKLKTNAFAAKNVC
jgi:diaminohydroxyphosphoribosylaminopyrimidine deaminase/5-amino-6-(5-phosphoribosylamino)uracil reductase